LVLNPEGPKPPKKQKIEERHALFEESTLLNDLEEDKPEGVVPLTIENSRLYFETREVSDIIIKTESISPQQQLSNFQREVTQWKSNLKRAMVSESISISILQEISPSTKLDRKNNSEVTEAELASLPEEFRNKLKYFFHSNQSIFASFLVLFSCDFQKLR